MSTPVYGETNTTGTPLLGADNGTSIYVDGNGTPVYGALSGGGAGPITTVDISTATYDGVFFDGGTRNRQCTDVQFKPDGTRMYVVGGNPDYVWVYDLTVPWDITSASYVNNRSLSHSNTRGIGINSDGTRMISAGSAVTMYNHNINPAWGSVQGTNDSASGFGSITAVRYGADNSTFYAYSSSRRTLQKYTMSTPGSLGTAFFVEESGDLSATLGTGSRCGTLSSNFTQYFHINESDNRVYQLDLATAGDVTSATYSGNSIYVGDTASTPMGISLNQDNNKLYVCDFGSSKIYQYSVSGT